MILIVRYDQLDRHKGELPQVSQWIKLQRGQNYLIVCVHWNEAQSLISQPDVV